MKEPCLYPTLRLGSPCPHPQELFLVNNLSARPDSPAFTGGIGRKQGQGQAWPHPTPFPVKACLGGGVVGLSPGSGPREPSPAWVAAAESEWTPVTAHLKSKHQATGPQPPRRARCSKSPLVTATKASGAGPASMGAPV